MSVPHRVCIIHLPSEQEFAWRYAVADAATGLGWTSWDYVAGQASPVDPRQDAVIHFSDARDVVGFMPTATAIIGATPKEAVRTLMSRFGIDELAALRSAARVFAFASDMAEGGISVIAASSTKANFPVIGEVSRGVSSPVEVLLTTLGDPLAFFDRLPAAVGAQAVWQPALFHWMAGDEAGVADLTGRTRILQHGPFLDLCSGQWTIEIRFKISLHRAKVDLRFEWGTGEDVQSSTQILDKSGLYSITLTKQWLEPAVGELRVWLDRAMFDGGLVIENCVVTKTG